MSGDEAIIVERAVHIAWRVESDCTHCAKLHSAVGYFVRLHVLTKLWAAAVQQVVVVRTTRNDAARAWCVGNVVRQDKQVQPEQLTVYNFQGHTKWYDRKREGGKQHPKSLFKSAVEYSINGLFSSAEEMLRFVPVSMKVGSSRIAANVLSAETPRTLNHLSIYTALTVSRSEIIVVIFSLLICAPVQNLIVWLYITRKSTLLMLTTSVLILTLLWRDMI